MTPMQSPNPDRPRWLDVHAAWQILGVLINSGPGQNGQFSQFHLDGNRLGYGTGAEAVNIVVTTRNFMDEQRESVDTKAAQPLAVGAKVRIVNVERRSAHGWQDHEVAPVGGTGTVTDFNDSEPAEMCWRVDCNGVNDWFYFAASELQVID